jgi:hypothetical protein
MRLIDELRTEHDLIERVALQRDAELPGDRSELPSRETTPEEEEARALGETLLSLYPPVHEPDVPRGDGCVVCPAFTRTCRGLELEWWNEPA